MTSSGHGTYLNTRVTLLARQLLTAEQIRQLKSADPGATEQLLASAGLGDLPLARVVADKRLESTLIQRLLQELVVLIRPLRGPARDFFVYWGHWFEIGNLKALVRGKMTGRGEQQIQAELLDIGPYQQLPIRTLLAAEDTAELLRTLESAGDYREIARHARRAMEQQGDLFSMDAALDRQYFNGLRKQLDKLPRPYAGELTALVGELLDQINLAWLLRYRFTYDLPAAQAYYLLAPAGNALGKHDLLRLAGADTLEQLIEQLPRPLRADLAGVTSSSEANERLQDRLWQQASRLLRARCFDLARPFAYLLLRERDIRAIRGVLKGRHLMLSRDLMDQAVRESHFRTPTTPLGLWRLSQSRKSAHV
jgi:V/A-type H+-transporting ATPase subunit C